MEITNLDIIRSVKPLKALADKGDIPFPAAFTLAKNISALDVAIADYIKKKTALDRDYLTEGSNPTVKTGMEEEYLKALTELNSATVRLSLEKIDPKALADTQFPPSQILPIMFMFT